ncbi:MAG: hypothetical protein OXI51_12000 [Chloroflexota bacterium]|nr:hypothetical protein [Chloroflexota bacterium]
MSRFELLLETRQLLCGAGFHDVDGALRAAAVELDSWQSLDGLHTKAWSDGSFRHYTNFLAWADTTAVGIDKGVKSSGDNSLIQRWRDLESQPIRQRFKILRNRALKGRDDVASWHADFVGDTLRMFRSFDGSWPGDVESQSAEYLLWLRDTALPLLVEAISLGATGKAMLEPEVPLSDQMPFPDIDPWTPSADPELAALMGGDAEVES